MVMEFHNSLWTKNIFNQEKEYKVKIVINLLEV